MADTKRSAYFISKEKTILVCLVKKYKDILENKKTDNKINKNKVECWKQIESEFNNESGQISRDTLTLRKKYENLERRTKKKFSDEKFYASGTGEGPSEKPPDIADIDLEIKQILAERINGFLSECGGGAEIITTTNMLDDNIKETFVDEMQEERIDIFNKERGSEGSNSKRKRNEYDAMCSKVSQ
ncbi:hypothetical protein JTB14_033010 [Gonioctena quinquepunctata]|nr:hypothetical protein JTB14_033010 [Gonioctena quinquepunctata]